MSTLVDHSLKQSWPSFLNFHVTDNTIKIKYPSSKYSESQTVFLELNNPKYTQTDLKVPLIATKDSCWKVGVKCFLFNRENQNNFSWQILL